MEDVNEMELLQIAPGGHPTWGGQPMRVLRYLDGGRLVKGYVLTPHRAAAWGTWIEVPLAATRRIGDLYWHEGLWLNRAHQYNGLLVAKGAQEHRSKLTEQSMPTLRRRASRRIHLVDLR